mgnify:CR=1 FL=1
MNFLNTLTNATTAFNTYAELTVAMRNGYVPTIYPKSRRQRILIRVIRANGFRVWPN